MSSQRWWRGDQTHLPYTGEAHVKGAWERCCRQGQHVDALAQDLEFLLLKYFILNCTGSSNSNRYNEGRKIMRRTSFLFSKGGAVRREK